MPPTPSSPPDSLPKNWNILVVAFVICGCSILLVFTYYTILRRLCSNSPTHSLSTNRRLLNDDPSLQFHSYGLDASIVQALPVLKFKKKMSEDQESNAGCAVCLGEFEDGDWAKHLPICTHAFHVSCIDTWFESHSNCPLCRSHVLYSNNSTISVLQTLTREDFFQERATHYQLLRSDVLRSSALRNEPAHTI